MSLEENKAIVRKVVEAANKQNLAAIDEFMHACMLYGFGNGIILVKPNVKVPAYFGGLLIFLFEAVLGGWLLFSSLSIL